MADVGCTRREPVERRIAKRRPHHAAGESDHQKKMTRPPIVYATKNRPYMISANAAFEANRNNSAGTAMYSRNPLKAGTAGVYPVPSRRGVAAKNQREEWNDDL